VANQATGGHLTPYRPLLHLAWQGDEKRATPLISATLREVTARDEGRGLAVPTTHAPWCSKARSAAALLRSRARSLAFCLSLCGDALCAGEVRR
jgi:hypothetical protein